MAKITVVTSNASMIHLNPVYKVSDIDSAVETIREQLGNLSDKDVAQESYIKRHKLTDSDIVQDFNQDMLWIAIGVRGYGDEYHKIADTTGIKVSDIAQMEAGLIKPSAKHHKLLADCLEFPEGFFTREGKAYTRNKSLCCNWQLAN